MEKGDEVIAGKVGNGGHWGAQGEAFSD